jgi:hypothetical protein
VVDHLLVGGDGDFRAGQVDTAAADQAAVEPRVLAASVTAPIRHVDFKTVQMMLQAGIAAAGIHRTITAQNDHCGRRDRQPPQGAEIILKPVGDGAAVLTLR